MDDDHLLRVLRARLEAEARDRLVTATYASVSAFERAVGLPLPRFYVRLLTEVANGVFAPGYGVIGIPPDGFVDNDLPGDLAQTYLEGRNSDDPAWRLPMGFLHLCNWGCGTFIRGHIFG